MRFHQLRREARPTLPSGGHQVMHGVSSQPAKQSTLGQVQFVMLRPVPATWRGSVPDGIAPTNRMCADRQSFPVAVVPATSVPGATSARGPGDDATPPVSRPTFRPTFRPAWSLLLPAAIGMAACSTAATSSMQAAPPRPSMAMSTPAPPPPYRIQVGDILAVRLLLNPELNEEVTVRPDGRISTTVAHDELASGRTVPQLDAALSRDYVKELQNPHVSVVVKSFAPARIYVGGEVANPGEFVNVGPELTVSQALTRAGGAKFSGDEKSVFIIRRGPNDAPEFLSVRYNDIITGRNPAADVRLAPYDVVYVPRTGVAEVYKFFNQYVQEFVPVSWGFSYSLGPGSSVH
jgi:polysaccharide export outer membrane protein